jgi:hypothetical protein
MSRMKAARWGRPMTFGVWGKQRRSYTPNELGLRSTTASTARREASAWRAVVGARFVITASREASAGRTVVGGRSASTESSEVSAGRRVVVGGRSASTEHGEACAESTEHCAFDQQTVKPVLKALKHRQTHTHTLACRMTPHLNPPPCTGSSSSRNWSSSPWIGSRTSSQAGLQTSGTLWLMMMMPFICSFRNKNEPTAIYPPSG